MVQYCLYRNKAKDITGVFYWRFDVSFDVCHYVMLILFYILFYTVQAKIHIKVSSLQDFSVLWNA